MLIPGARPNRPSAFVLSRSTYSASHRKAFMVALPLPNLPENISELRDLALDLRWTWSHEADALWREIDDRLWHRTRNPWSVLQAAPPERLERLAVDPSFQ